MPYELKKVKKDKFKVCKKDDKKVCFSKKALSKKTAIKQKYAIEQSERRRFGLGRSTNSFSPADYKRYFEKYKKKMKEKYPDLPPFDFDDFVNDFEIHWEANNDTVNDTIYAVVEGTRKYHRLEKQSKLDTDDEEEKVTAYTDEQLKARKKKQEDDDDEIAKKQKEKIDEKEKEMKLLFEEYLRRNPNEGQEEEELDFDDFKTKYDEIDSNHDGDLNESQILERILDPYMDLEDNEKEAVIYGKELWEKIDEENIHFIMKDGTGNTSIQLMPRGEDLMYLKNYLYNRFEDKTNEKDPKTGVYKKGEEQILSIVVDWSDQENFGNDYDEQQVDDRNDRFGKAGVASVESIVFDPENWNVDMYYKYKVLSELKILINYANSKDSGRYFCQNICDGKVLGSNGWSAGTSGVKCYNFYVDQKQKNDYVYSGMDNCSFREDETGNNYNYTFTPEDNEPVTAEYELERPNIHADTICSARFGFIAFNELRKIYQNDGKGDFINKPFDYFDLYSLSPYSTVNFYWQQGAYGYKLEYDTSFKERIFTYLDKNFKTTSFKDAIKIILHELMTKRGCSDIKEALYNLLDLGDSKFFIMSKEEEEWLYDRDKKSFRLKQKYPDKNKLPDDEKIINVIYRGDDIYLSNKNQEVVLQEYFDQLFDEIEAPEDDTEENILYNKVLLLLKERNKKYPSNQVPIPTRKVFKNLLDTWDTSFFKNKEKTANNVSLLLERVTEPSRAKELASRKKQAVRQSARIIKEARKENPDLTITDVFNKTKLKGRLIRDLESEIRPVDDKRYNLPSLINSSMRDDQRFPKKARIIAKKDNPLNEPRKRYLATKNLNASELDQVGDVFGQGLKGVKFYEELRSYGIDPVKYLSYMKKQAKKAGYDSKQLMLDNDDKHKLRISTEQGVKHFGAVGYKDFYIYTHLEKDKKVPKGTAKQMRDRFQKSHGAITTKNKLGRNSANELALKILW
jgi:hypothetical protein